MINKINKDNINVANQLLKAFNRSVNDYDNNPFSHILLYEDKGIIIYTKIYDRVEIEYIIVSNDFQRKGIASKLLNYVIDNNKDITNITLEVREGNNKAIQFYKHMGFIESTRRKRYYGSEDALLMIRKFDKDE